MDLVEKGKEAMGGVEKFFAKLPGIKGYREKEMRREADRRLREGLARRLSAQRRRLSALQLDLLKAGGLEWMDDLDRVVGKLQLLIDRINRADYGYAPFFDLERIKEEALDRLAQFDQALAERLPEVVTGVDNVATAVTAKEGIGDALGSLTDVLVELNELFGQRDEAIRAVEIGD
ncbi:MAG: hypothetical protein QHJ81_14195 [Anaerolineae bacterium]|nr:hypothetical protein [Anaerolineae bacterium]